MPNWRKSRRCEKEDACVEVARLPGSTIGVRDSVNPVDGPVLRFSVAAWKAFRARID
ncbi:hypothetical protein GCM10010191_52910 [Actinomadura vinacea]|uniref:DUF397 domain-containing protein n=1 Tax=Actinomadura vinacea TaxID=115336 RepID=A0ABN3JM92_9ACTN